MRQWFFWAEFGRNDGINGIYKKLFWIGLIRLRGLQNAVFEKPFLQDAILFS
jgi:hypothetical protein